MIQGEFVLAALLPAKWGEKKRNIFHVYKLSVYSLSTSLSSWLSKRRCDVFLINILSRSIYMRVCVCQFVCAKSEWPVCQQSKRRIETNVSLIIKRNDKNNAWWVPMKIVLDHCASWNFHVMSFPFTFTSRVRDELFATRKQKENTTRDMKVKLLQKKI